MTLRSRTFALLLSVALIFSPLPLFADGEAEYDEQTIAEVNAHFSKGAKLFYDEDYDGAIAEFEAAHAKIPNAIFLYNISLALSKKGEHRRSLEVANQAKAFGGLGPNEAQQNDARIVALNRVVASEDAAKAIADRQKIGEPLLDFGLLSWVGSGLVVAGVLGFASVAVTDRNLKEDVQAYKDAAARNDVQQYEALRDEIRPRQNVARVLFVLSSAAVVAGAGLLTYDLVLKNDGDGVSLSPMFGAPGLVLHGQF